MVVGTNVLLYQLLLQIGNASKKEGGVGAIFKRGWVKTVV